MAARAGQGAGGDGVVARGAQQVQTGALQAGAVGQHVHHLAVPRLLGTAEDFSSRVEMPPALLPGRVLVDGLLVVDEVLLEVVDHLHRLVEGLLVLAAGHQDALGAKHLRHLGQHRAAPCWIT